MIMRKDVKECLLPPKYQASYISLQKLMSRRNKNTPPNSLKEPLQLKVKNVHRKLSSDFFRFLFNMDLSSGYKVVINYYFKNQNQINVKLGMLLMSVS